MLEHTRFCVEVDAMPELRWARRAALTMLLSGALLAFAPSGARALNDDEAKQFVEETVGEVVTLINANGPPATQASGLRALLERRADMDAIARYSLGVAWRSASDAEKGAFTEAFKDYIAAKYSRRFNDYRNEAVQVRRAVDEGQRGFRVLTEIGGTSERVAVEWRLTDRNGPTRVFDLVIEGVSLLTSERELIGSLLEQRGGDINAVIADIRS
ncbi:MAG: ABC transporter substrate-binding protein [Pseudomonadota bacterium]